MAEKAKVLVLRTAGVNCDMETQFAFRSCGAQADLVHINQLLRGETALGDYHILALPGGFSYGDDIASGRIVANELRILLGEQVKKFMADGKLIIGICNGFQVLVKAGILPDLSLCGPGKIQAATLTNNDSGKFEDRWVRLKSGGRCVWTEGLGEIIYLPVAHGEGKFFVEDTALLKKWEENGQIVFRYCSAGGGRPQYPDNPNGSMDDIAGITDPTGRILGLMPHPERHFLFTQHPFWTRLEKKGRFGHGAKIFENGVRYVRERFLSEQPIGASGA
ncbi:MAG: phosphoribosylformylglycinamidine synthase I [Candidatus Omnitrophota bacterium]|nr:phosphoribosylformylglycinamidine synthase I [Candidatus Omnitrophota bacterium]MDZ4241915.1 phosphoribosylformylglycinamidine synthase I [Candidatus Omnitrophota bacterium]